MKPSGVDQWQLLHVLVTFVVDIKFIVSATWFTGSGCSYADVVRASQGRRDDIISDAFSMSMLNSRITCDNLSPCTERATAQEADSDMGRPQRSTLRQASVFQP